MGLFEVVDVSERTFHSSLAPARDQHRTWTKCPPNRTCAPIALSRFTWSPTFRSPAKHAHVPVSVTRPRVPFGGSRQRTEIGPVQSLVREPDLEPPAPRLLVELNRRQARAVHRNRVTDVAVDQDGRRVADSERAPTLVVDNLRNGAKMLDM